MDSLTFGSTVVLRHMTFSEARWGRRVFDWVWLEGREGVFMGGCDAERGWILTIDFPFNGQEVANKRNPFGQGVS